MKLLSVAIPCYNVEQYLEKSLNSYCDERLKESLEVLIVNDGSTDKTKDISLKYVEKFPEIFKLVDKENGGHGSAVNAGLANATGKYFRVIDGDDWVNTDDLAELLLRLETINTDMVVDQKREVNMVTLAEKYFPFPKRVQFDKTYHFLDICENDMSRYYHMHNMSVKRTLLIENDIRLREKVFYVDYEFVLKITALVDTLTFVDLDVYRYLIGNVNQSVDNQNFVRRYDHHNKVLKECLRFVRDGRFEGKRLDYLNYRVKLLIHTQYTIALIYDLDRRRGLERSKELSAFLKADYPYFYQITRKRYRTARFLHTFGVDYDKLQKLKGGGTNA